MTDDNFYENNIKKKNREAGRLFFYHQTKKQLHKINSDKR